MEEMIWVYIGVISVIIAFGIIFTNVKELREETKINKIEWSIEKYKSDHNFICKSAERTKVGVDIDLPSGTVLVASDDRICLTLDTETRCELLDCDFDAPYTLDLDTTMPDRSVSSHKYKCYLEKVIDHVSIDCQG